MTMIASTLVVNSSSAPSASSHAPSAAVMPTTASGGTSEIAIATPGRMSPMSRRAMASEPARPVAAAATRSISVGAVRPVIWLLASGATSSGSTHSAERADRHDRERGDQQRARRGQQRVQLAAGEGDRRRPGSAWPAGR